MAENKITLKVELCAEDRKALQIVIDQLAHLSFLCEKYLPRLDAAPAPAAEEAHPVENPFPVAQAPAPEEVEPVPVAEPAKVYTLQEVRDRVMALSRQSDEMKARVKEELNKYAKSVQTLHPDFYSEFMAALEVL